MFLIRFLGVCSEWPSGSYLAAMSRSFFLLYNRWHSAATVLNVRVSLAAMSTPRLEAALPKNMGVRSSNLAYVAVVL